MQNKKNKLIIILLSLLFLVVSSVFFYLSYQNKIGNSLVVKTSDGKEHNFKIEIADDPQEWEMGLMFRKDLAENAGMLFKMEEGVKMFWMKNTYIPLDIIFIDSNGVIKTIHKNAKPESLTPISSNVSVNTVLEINGGMTDTLGIKEGDVVFVE